MSDGLSELEADGETIYAFMRENSRSDIGMCQKSDLKAFLAEFTK